ncbi:MAG: T9SS type A sorting domain-containing protein, partial [Ignavibacteriae bacterium]|nr:T9SS type A sorting domain-containing protein [Ignavibacteriota bacterium]
IKFGLPTQSVVDLRIYDILGREVRALVNNEDLKAGTYSYNFDASALASGTYIYRLTTGNNVVSKKMLLLK